MVTSILLWNTFISLLLDLVHFRHDLLTPCSNRYEFGSFILNLIFPFSFLVIAVARGAVGRPYIFAELQGKIPEYDITELVKEHFSLLESVMPERVAVNCIKKHVAGYTYGLRGGKDVKVKVFQATTKEDILSVADSFKNLTK